MEMQTNISCLYSPPLCATWRHNHRIAWVVHCQTRQISQVLFCLLQMAQEIAAGAHIGTARKIAAGQSKCHNASGVRAADGDKTLHAVSAAQRLQIMPCHNAAHTESNQYASLARRNACFHDGLDLLGKFGEACPSVGAEEAWRVGNETVLVSIAHHERKNSTGIENTVNKDDMAWGRSHIPTK